MPIYRVTTQWSGFSGAPGYTNFFFNGDGVPLDAADLVNRVRAFWSGINARLPASVRLQVQGEVAVVDEATGMVDSFAQTAAPAVLAGTGTGNYSAATGACVGWTTDAVRNGRRVRGRTFVVPLANSGYDADGTLAAAVVTDLTAAATALGGTEGAHLVVWARPSAPGAADGAAYFVTGNRVQDKAAVLRSRRD